MQTTRIFIDCPLQAGATIKLDTHAAGHVARVLRLHSDDEITLFNGLGGEYPATLQLVSKREVTALINSHIERNTESPLHITLAQGISRGERMDYTLQKATELGISRIVPLLTQRCNVQLKGDRLEKRSPNLFYIRIEFDVYRSLVLVLPTSREFMGSLET